VAGLVLGTECGGRKTYDHSVNRHWFVGIVSEQLEACFEKETGSRTKLPDQDLLNCTEASHCGVTQASVSSLTPIISPFLPKLRRRYFDYIPQFDDRA
jgi:hypothetical protein